MRAAPSPQLHTLTLSQALEGLRTGAFTSVALTRSFLERIEAVEPAVSAWITVVGERALEQAARADARRAAGEESALLGIPFAAKDLLSTEGVRTTCGSKMLEHYIPPYTATAVRRLEDAGMVLLGKTNMDEFAMGSSTENSAWGVTHNPWNLQRVPGGSSGGSAAAVAAQMAPVALGSDTGGSIRLPASFCGVVGIRPSYGRVSRYGLVAYGSSLDQVGILSQTVRDAALLLEAIAGHDPLDSTSLPAPVPAYGRTLEGGIVGLRIGLPQEYLGEGLQPAVEEAVRGAVARFAELGATIVPISLPNTAHALPVYYLVATAEASANLARFDGVRFGHSAGADSIQENYRLSRSQGFGPEVKRRIMLGAYALSAGYYDAYYLKAQQVRTLIRDDFRRAFAQVDLIVGPVSATTAFPLGDRSDDPLAMYLTDLYTATLNLAGICGMSVPCGFDGEGLPIGLQLMGPSLGEERLLRAAHAFESATDWHLRRAAEAPLLGKQLPA